MGIGDFVLIFLVSKGWVGVFLRCNLSVVWLFCWGFQAVVCEVQVEVGSSSLEVVSKVS